MFHSSDLHPRPAISAPPLLCVVVWSSSRSCVRRQRLTQSTLD